MMTIDDMMADWEAEQMAERAANEAKREAWLKTADGKAWKEAFDRREANTPIEVPAETRTSCEDCGDDLNDDDDCPSCDC